MTTAMFFFFEKKLDFYATICHILTNVCKNKEELLECLDQAILDVIDNPVKTQQTPSIGTLF
jgi:hypothetical protein